MQNYKYSIWISLPWSVSLDFFWLLLAISKNYKSYRLKNVKIHGQRISQGDLFHIEFLADLLGEILKTRIKNK